MSKPTGTLVLLGTLPSSTFVTHADLAQHTLEFARHYPFERPDSILACARSGLLPGTILSCFWHVPLFLASPREYGIRSAGGGYRISRAENTLGHRVLLIDDSAANGTSIDMILKRNQYELASVKLTRAAIYASPQGSSVVDLCAYLYPKPHYFEWCFANTYLAQFFAFDFDGILCEDPYCPEPSEVYINFLRSAKPLYLPLKFPVTIITARCAEYRQLSLDWLRKHGVQVRRLIMWEGAAQDRWTTPTRVAEWKANWINQLRQENIRGYVESSPHQAEKIAEILGIPVICPAARRVFGGTLLLP